MASQCVARLLVAVVSPSSRLLASSLLLFRFEGEVLIFLGPFGPSSLAGEEEVPQPVQCCVALMAHAYAGQINASEPLIGPSVDGAWMTPARQGLCGLLECNEIIEPPGF